MLFWCCLSILRLNLLVELLAFPETFILSVTSHIYCIVAPWPDKHCLSHCTVNSYLYQVNVTIFKSKPRNRIPGSCLLISSFPDSASRKHVESLGRASLSKPCLVNPISWHSPSILYMYNLNHIGVICTWHFRIMLRRELLPFVYILVNCSIQVHVLYQLETLSYKV